MMESYTRTSMYFLILGFQIALKVFVQCWAMSWNNVQIRVCSVLLAYFNTLYQFKPVKNTDSEAKNKLLYQKKYKSS